jgi:hypothetical protein
MLIRAAPTNAATVGADGKPFADPVLTVNQINSLAHTRGKVFKFVRQ